MFALFGIIPLNMHEGHMNIRFRYTLFVDPTII